MPEETRHFTTQLAVIGSGIAGFAASIFALNRHITTAQIGNTGAVAYTTGYLDLLGKLDETAESVTDPWQALKILRTTQPKHPLSRIDEADIHQGFAEFTAFLAAEGIAYSTPGKTNLTALSPIGTLKQTLCVPATMAAGPPAFAAGNAVILKPSSFTPLTACLLAEVLLDAGMPKGFLGVLHGSAEVVQALQAEGELVASPMRRRCSSCSRPRRWMRGRGSSSWAWGH